MARKLFREPDGRSGPAALGRKPVILPEERERAVDKVKETLDL